MRLTFCLFLMLIAVMKVTAQRVEKYYDFQWKPTDASSARFYSVMEKKDSVWDRSDYFIHERILQMHGTYKDEAGKIPHGVFRYYHSNKTLKSTGSYKNGKRDGLWLSFHPNGAMQDSAFYINDSVVGTSQSWYANSYPADSAVYTADGSGVFVSWFDDGAPSSAGRYTTGYKKNGTWQYFHSNGKLSAKEVCQAGKLVNKQYYDEDGMAMSDTTNEDRVAIFKGGPAGWAKFLEKQIYFPTQFKIVNADKAVVVVEGTVNEEGVVSDVQVTTPFYPEFDKIALNAVKKSPKWQPAISHNRRVKYRFTQAVFFAQVEE